MHMTAADNIIYRAAHHHQEVSSNHPDSTELHRLSKANMAGHLSSNSMAVLSSNSMVVLHQVGSSTALQVRSRDPQMLQAISVS